jgi:hypothetical protein
MSVESDHSLFTLIDSFKSAKNVKKTTVMEARKNTNELSPAARRLLIRLDNTSK